jgi:hypothetical protein
MLAPKIPIEVLVYVPCGVHLSTGWHAKPSLCLCHNGGAAPNRNAHVNRIITLYGIVTIDIAHLGPRTADSGQRTVDCARSVWHSGAPTPRPRAPGNDDQGPQELHDMPSTQHAARGPASRPVSNCPWPCLCMLARSPNQVQCSTPRHPTNVTEVRRYSHVNNRLVGLSSPLLFVTLAMLGYQPDNLPGSLEALVVVWWKTRPTGRGIARTLVQIAGQANRPGQWPAFRKSFRKWVALPLFSL